MGQLLYWTFLLLMMATNKGLAITNAIFLASPTEIVSENNSVSLTCSDKSGTVFESRWVTSMYENKIAACVRLNNNCLKTNFLNNSILLDCVCNNDGSYTVVLKHVDRYQHGVTWKCGNINITSNAVVINVSVPVTHAVLTQSGNETVYENAIVSFTCSSSYCLPTAQINWYRSYYSSTVEITDIRDVGLKRKTETREDNVIRVTETLSYRVNRSVNGWSVYCNATNWQSYAVTSEKTELSIIYPPDRPPVIDGFTNGSTYRVVENEKVNLSCSVTGGNPLAKPEWHCERIDNITSNELITNKETITSYLSWVAKRTDETTCTCKTGHVLSTISTYVSIDILYRASVKQFVVSGKLYKHNVPDVANESNFITFSCKIDSNPNSTVKIITPNGTEIIFTGTNMIEYSHFLSSCMDNGLYTCSGSNDYNYGHPGVAELPVFVKCTPMAFVHTKTDIRSKLYVPVILQFIAVAYPDPEFIWEKWANGSWQQLTNGKQFNISSHKLQSNLTVSNFTKRTVYRLLVVNEIGRFIQNYTLIPFGAPETPKEFREIEELLTDTSVTLLWKPGFNGGTLQTFIITYVYEKDDDLNNIAIQDDGFNEMNLTVHGLSMDSRYTFQLIAVNSEGISDSVTLRIKTKGYSDGKQTNSIVIGIISGTMSFLVLAISLAASVLLRRRYQKKKNSDNEEKSYDNLTEMTTMSVHAVGKSSMIHTPLYEELRPVAGRDNKTMEQPYAILTPEQGNDGATFQTYTNLKL